MSLAQTSLEAMTYQRATVNYVTRSNPPPRVYYIEPPAGVPWSTVKSDPRTVAIHDVRGAEGTFTLGRDGIQFPRHRFAFHEFDDDDAVRQKFYPVFLDYARDLTGLSRAAVFDHAVRRRAHGFGGVKRTGGTTRKIADFAHNDYTPMSAESRARRAFNINEGTTLPRFTVTNFWFPVATPLLDHPLALCADGSVSPGDFIDIENVYSHGMETIAGLGYNPAHRWFYKSALEEGEFLAFRTWDSGSAINTNVPHVAFMDPSVGSDVPPRHSFEIRVIAFCD